jgi:hypothetical protein
MISAAEILLILLLLICIVCAILLCRVTVAKNEQADAIAVGGGPHRQTTRPKRKLTSEHLVVDTLNLVHWLRKNRQADAPVTTAEIVLAIDRTAPQLRRRYSGTLVYVLKDQESQLNSSEIRAQYQEAAERNRVHVACAERSDFAALGAQRAGKNVSALAGEQASHSALGRDDFYMCLQADRYQCAVATCDRLRDFAEFRDKVAPFHTVTFVYWRATPERDFIRPASPAYARLRKPLTIEFSDLLK